MELDMPTVLDAMPVGVYVSDAHGTLIFVNKHALHIAGASSIEEIRAQWPHPFHFPCARTEDGKPIPPNLMPMQRALAGEEVVHETEVFDQESRGTVYVRTRSNPIRAPSGTIIGAIKVVVDITKEHELAEAKDEFIRQAAHELKTPIAVIKATAESLVTTEQPAAVYLGALIRGVDRMDSLIASLLDLADLEGGIFSFSRFPVALEGVVEASLTRLSSGAARRVQVTAEHCMVEADEIRLRRAIYALVDNALKYSPPNTSVHIAVTREQEVARIAIRDHGFGIPPDKQSHIFEKYYRAHLGTERDAGGIGVGLFVAREIIQQHHGRIWFDSTENRGSVFYIEMPIEAEVT
jgi:PAS domain S-box-containing protein